MSFQLFKIIYQFNNFGSNLECSQILSFQNYFYFIFDVIVEKQLSCKKLNILITVCAYLLWAQNSIYLLRHNRKIKQT